MRQSGPKSEAVGDMPRIGARLARRLTKLLLQLMRTLAFHCPSSLMRTPNQRPENPRGIMHPYAQPLPDLSPRAPADEAFEHALVRSRQSGPAAKEHARIGVVAQHRRSFEFACHLTQGNAVCLTAPSAEHARRLHESLCRITLELSRAMQGAKRRSMASAGATC